MEPVRWGVIGIGGHFIRRMLLPMQKSDVVDLYGVASRKADKAQSVAQKYGIPKAYGSYNELLEDKSIEAVYICLPNHLHVDWIRKCADAGKHILCEKPLSLRKDRAVEAMEYCREKNVLLMEAFMYRFHEQWQRARELCHTGGIGDVRCVQTFFSYMNTDPGNIRNDPQKGGGGILDIGCYAVSVARYIYGREPERAMSLVNFDPNFKVDVLASAILDFGENAHSIFTVGTQTFPHQKVEVIGTSGRIEILIPFNTYEDVPVEAKVTSGIGTRSVFFGPEDHYKSECDALSHAIRNGDESPLHPIDAVGNMAVLDALFRSNESNSWEKV